MRLVSLWRGRMGMVALAAAGALLLAACSNGGPTASAQGGGGASSGSANGAAAVGTDKVDGVGTVLDASGGRTLYYNTQEAGGKIVCTGSCVDTWPPMLMTGSAPATPGGISGSLGTIERPDGSTQLTFDGFPLYMFSGDTAAGQATGQGLEGIWFAAPSTGIQGAAGSGGGGSGSRGGYGY